MQNSVTLIVILPVAINTIVLQSTYPIATKHLPPKPCLLNLHLYAWSVVGVYSDDNDDNIMISHHPSRIGFTQRVCVSIHKLYGDLQAANQFKRLNFKSYIRDII